MHRPRPTHPPELRQKVAELARIGRNAACLMREFEPTETTIHYWVAQVSSDTMKSGKVRIISEQSGGVSDARSERQKFLSVA